MCPVSRTYGTIFYSFLYLHLRRAYWKLKYTYSVISVIVHLLPAHTKILAIDLFVGNRSAIFQFFHFWADRLQFWKIVSFVSADKTDPIFLIILENIVNCVNWHTIGSIPQTFSENNVAKLLPSSASSRRQKKTKKKNTKTSKQYCVASWLLRYQLQRKKKKKCTTLSNHFRFASWLLR